MIVFFMLVKVRRAFFVALLSVSRGWKKNLVNKCIDIEILEDSKSLT